MRRPFLQNSTEQILKCARNFPHDVDKLVDARNELALRNSRAAGPALKEVEDLLELLGVSRKSTGVNKSDSVKRDEARAANPSTPGGKRDQEIERKQIEARQSEAAGPKIAELRQQLLDLSARNRLLNFKHSARGARYVRVIDEEASGLFKQLQSDRAVEFVPLKDPPEDPVDEQTDKFQDALSEAILTDRIYLEAVAKIEADEADDAEARLRSAERSLRDRLRRELGMPTRREAQPSLQEYAKSLGLSPSFDLTENKLRSRRRPSSEWQTLQLDDELRRKLKGIAQQARESLNEYGVETLHVVFGFLEWSPPTADGVAADVLFSPLVLQPVGIKRHQAVGSHAGGDDLLLDDEFGRSLRPRERYKLSTENSDTPSVNLTLRERLKDDYEFTLPELDSETPDLEKFFGQLEESITDFPNWRIRRFVTLTHLSFSRLPMWLDLDPDLVGVTAPDEHPILRELFGGRSSGGGGESNDGENTPNEKQPIPHLLLDCDSSQYAAIKEVLTGRNLVIQGPPGTGKSQTIANLIGAALGQGKSVLFVAEKQVALNVVHSRLKDVGLEPFLLELHSARVGKKAVIESIRNAIDARKHGPQFFANTQTDVRANVEKYRQGLDDYVKAINAKYGAAGWTLHTIIWKEIKFEDHPIPSQLADANLPCVKSWTLEDWNDNKRLLSDWHGLRQSVRSEGRQHPWYWVSAQDIHLKQEEEIVRYVRRISGQLKLLGERISDSELGANSKLNLDEVERQITLIAELGSVPATPADDFWMFALRKDSARSISDAESAKAKREAAELMVRSVASDIGFFDDSTLAAIESASAHVRTLEASNASFSSLSELKEFQRSLNPLVSSARQILEILSRLRSFENLPNWESDLNGASNTLKYIELASFAPSGIWGRKIDCRSDVICEALSEAAKMAQHLQEEQARLQECLSVPLNSLKEEEIVETEATLSKGWWGSFLFNPDYRRARRFVKNNIDPSHQSAAGSLLLKTTEFHKALRELDSHRSVKLSDGLVHGLESDVGQIREVVDWIQEVRTSTPLIEQGSQELRAAVFAVRKDMSRACVDLQNKDWIERLGLLKKASDSRKVSMLDIDSKLESESSIALTLIEQLSAWNWQPEISTERLEFLAEQIRIRIESQSTLQKFECEYPFLFPDLTHSITVVRENHELVRRIKRSGICETWVDKLLSLERDSRWQELISIGTGLADLFSEIEDPLIQLRSRSIDLKEYPRVLVKESIEELISIFEVSLQDEPALRPKWRLLATEHVLQQKNLSEFIRKLGKVPPQYADVGQLFERIAIHKLCLAAFEESDALKPFRHSSPNELRDKFREYDELLKASDGVDLVSGLESRDVPMGNSYGKVSTFTDYSLLKHVCGLERPRTPVRDLLRRAGNALKAIKPCFMMSPLSVAQLIDRSSVQFDLVVFDEASQIKPADALSAMMRAKQFVVVGDRMQLPPTAFGARTAQVVEANIDEEEEESPVVESILELSAAAYGDGPMLLWHYRSRDPSLIAFSNREFYQNNLRVFPAPRAKSLNSGVSYLQVNGTYSARTNVLEAKICAKSAIEYMKAHPERSIGLVALNKPQAELIELELDRMIDDDPIALDYKAKWGEGLEPLFVKNLESVQGDERDVIFISTVFGNDPNGNFFQRFGPITSQAGHRRLNVLFTRAKHHVVVVSSIPTEKIKLSESSHWGVRVLRGYLEYAKSGRLEYGEETGRSADSPFEEAVTYALKAKGYDCVPQVGVEGFFIDLAVKNPENPNQFILGVECDGASYHSSKSARDRDRLRQDILESLGWDIYRIWSTDWFADSKREMAKLIARIQELIEAKRSSEVFGELDFDAIAGNERRTSPFFEDDPSASEAEGTRGKAKPFRLVADPVLAQLSSEEYLKLSKEEIESAREPIHKKLLEEAFNIDPGHFKEVEIHVNESGALAGARLEEAYDVKIYQWLQKNPTRPLAEMPWPAGVDLQTKIYLRAQAVRSVVLQVRRR